MEAISVAVLISSFAFISYGAFCLFSNGMKAEFKRFGLLKLRLLTGFLELLGGIGLLVGLSLRPLLPLASGGLCLLMGIGLVIRFRAHDKWLELMPAVFFMLLNFTICFLTAKEIF